MIQRFFFLLIGLFLPLSLAAQELKCTVRVDIRSLSGTEYSYLRDLEHRITSYLNERNWTEDVFQDVERIECQITINILEDRGNDTYRAQLSLVSRRPIYGTTQQTTVLQLNDTEWQFKYARNQPLIFDLNRFDPLTSVLDFYAYLIIGYDYDTFDALGGTLYLEKARRIAELAQASGQTGWLAGSNNKSRTAIVTQLLDPRLRPFRKALFDYHFGCLDHFIQNPTQARKKALEALQAIQKILQEMARPYVVDLFFATKYQELVSIFEDAPERQTVYGILLEIDPSHMNTYNRLAM